ncbi:MAG: ATP-binding cassette domain-containing protein [Chloroflexi bacterium]|nr:ATP-binding cassette domain-containing protein [Chloroflexota bacterium]
MLSRFFGRNGTGKHVGYHEHDHLIEVRQVIKDFDTAAGKFRALKSVNLTVNRGEFVAVIGKSGSGKSTLINMLTGIDRPSEGEVFIANTAVHTLNEGQMAQWRGRTIGVVFQFFQLLPTLTIAENVMLPMDFCHMYTPRERRERAMQLLAQMDMAEQAHKLPSAVSGGQQQRAAIARALANDPPIICADEPTGNLDSRTATQVFEMFEQLVDQGKTILMVTHDQDLARRVSRTVVIADGEIVDEYLARALPGLSEAQLLDATRRLKTDSFEPGSIIIREGEPGERFFVVRKGRAEVVLTEPNGQEITVEYLHPGQYFGGTALLTGGGHHATVRADPDSAVEIVSLDREAFAALVSESQAAQAHIAQSATARVSTVEQLRQGTPA